MVSRRVDSVISEKTSRVRSWPSSPTSGFVMLSVICLRKVVSHRPWPHKESIGEHDRTVSKAYILDGDGLREVVPGFCRLSLSPRIKRKSVGTYNVRGRRPGPSSPSDLSTKLVEGRTVSGKEEESAKVTGHNVSRVVSSACVFQSERRAGDAPNMKAKKADGGRSAAVMVAG